MNIHAAKRQIKHVLFWFIDVISKGKPKQRCIGESLQPHGALGMKLSKRSPPPERCFYLNFNRLLRGVQVDDSPPWWVRVTIGAAVIHDDCIMSYKLTCFWVRASAWLLPTIRQACFQLKSEVLPPFLIWFKSNQSDVNESILSQCCFRLP